jgi:hypothetical protein
MTKQKCRQSGFTLFRERYYSRDVTDIVGKAFDIEALTVRMSPTSEIHGIDGEAASGEAFCGPRVVTAMGIEAGNDADHAASLSKWTPVSDENLETA